MDINQNKNNPALRAYVKLMRTSSTITAKMHAHLADHNLTTSQFGVLEALFHLGPLCQKDIGEKILKTSGNMTLVIDNLEKRGLVKRRPGKEDRRFIDVHLTQKGDQLIREIFPRHMDTAQKLFSVLSPEELEMLGDFLTRLSGLPQKQKGDLR